MVPFLFPSILVSFGWSSLHSILFLFLLLIPHMVLEVHSSVAFFRAVVTTSRESLPSVQRNKLSYIPSLLPFFFFFPIFAPGLRPHCSMDFGHQKSWRRRRRRTNKPSDSEGEKFWRRRRRSRCTCPPKAISWAFRTGATQLTFPCSMLTAGSRLHHFLLPTSWQTLTRNKKNQWAHLIVDHAFITRRHKRLKSGRRVWNKFQRLSTLLELSFILWKKCFRKRRRDANFGRSSGQIARETFPESLKFGTMNHSFAWCDSQKKNKIVKRKE